MLPEPQEKIYQCCHIICDDLKWNWVRLCSILKWKFIYSFMMLLVSEMFWCISEWMFCIRFLGNRQVCQKKGCKPGWSLFIVHSCSPPLRMLSSRLISSILSHSSLTKAWLYLQPSSRYHHQPPLNNMWIRKQRHKWIKCPSFSWSRIFT